MRYRVISHADRETLFRDEVLLLQMSWNDWWQYKTTYYAYYANAVGKRVELGGVKIGKVDFDYIKSKLTNGDRAPLDGVFDNLASGFVSLGQDESYYENVVRNLGVNASSVLRGMNDLANDSELFDEHRTAPVVWESLMRNVPTTSVEGVFRKIIAGDTSANSYDFTFVRSSPAPAWLAEPLSVSFAVTPNSNPPTNVHVLIGRNGSGKTRLLSAMTNTFLGIEESSGNVTSANGEAPRIANLVHIGFSAFDVVEVPIEDDPLRYNIAYSYVGLHYRAGSKHKSELSDSEEDLLGPRRTRPASDLGGKFAESAWRVISERSRELWRESLENLESDPNFKDAQVSDLADWPADDSDGFAQSAGELFQKLSSGHKIVLLSVTRLVETVTEQTLVLVDEPEGHLHPPLLSAFVRTISDLMKKRNGVAIIATHSPVILQEVPRKCVWKIDRNGSLQSASRPEIETFGENVGTLTNTVFGLEVQSAGFHRMLAEVALDLGDYDAVVRHFGGELGFEARALLRAWFATSVPR